MISRIDIEDMTDAQDEAPARIRVARDADGFWTCREAVSGSPEYVRSDLARPSQAGDERVERLRDVACGATTMISHALDDGHIDEEVAGNFETLLTDLNNAIAAMDTPKGGGDGWQPIETCPIETDVLIWESGDVCRASLRIAGDEAYWECLCTQPVVCTPEPTHWMPLPAPPAAMKDGGE